MGPTKLRDVAAPMRRMSPASTAAMISSSTPAASCRACHSAADRSRYFSVTISRIGPTFCAMPPCTSTSESCRVEPTRTGSWVGSRRPRLVPCSGSCSVATTPRISFAAGQTPPESCQPPPLPPSHSPRIARAATSRRSGSVSWPVSDWAWPVARMQTAMSAASRLVETASREPLGMLLTLLTISRPWPGPTTRANRSARLAPDPSTPGGTIPAAITAAFRSPR